MTDTFAIQLNCGHTVRHQGRAPVVMDPWWCPFGDLSTLVASVWQTDESGDLQTHLEESDRIIFGDDER